MLYEMNAERGQKYAAAAASLFGSFDDIWIADMRFCGTSAVRLARDKGITYLLFCCSAYTASGEGSYYTEKIT